MPLETLVAVDHAGRTVAIMRDDLGVWLEGFPVLRPARVQPVGLDERHVAVGGWLPDGATGAVAVDAGGRETMAATGHGAWLAIVPAVVVPLVAGAMLRPAADRAVAVRFVDGGGRIVAAPDLHPGVPRTAVEDATVRCPACGARVWDALADGPVRCRVCGYDAAGGTMSFAFADVARRRLRWPRPGRRRAARTARREDRATLERLPFPAYVVVGAGRPRVVERAAPAETLGPVMRLDRLTVRHGDDDGAWTDVQSGVRRADAGDADLVARAAAATSDPRTLRLARSPGAVALWMAAERRRTQALALDATRADRPIPVDGEPHDFRVVEVDGAWAATAPVGAVRVTVTATGVRPDDLALRRWTPG